jgi:hypothetical protein
MDAKNKPSDETVAATDEIFSRKPVPHPEPGSPDTEPVFPGGQVLDPSEPIPPPSLRPDYVRELQQEFDEQEEEGKV